MGIDFLTYSKINPDMYKEDDPNQYLKYALRDIEWFKILDLLNINLGNNALNYWCQEQVEDIYNRIKSINEDPYNLYSGWEKEELEEHMIDDINKAIKLKDDIEKLCEYFKFLVDNKAYIRIF
jgi:hypothetical protein